jgi:hypothetical protein
VFAINSFWNVVKFTMYDYLEGILAESPDDMKGMAIMPAHSKSFQVDQECEKLNPLTADWFHCTVARLLFASKRARPDLQTVVAYLCTRIACPDKDDYGKLKKLIDYLCESIYLPLILGWDESGILTWSVDASFAVHMDMRSHTGYGFNRIPVITPILGTDFRVLFLRGCISLKHRSYRPLLRDNTSPFKSTCLLITLK